MPLITEKAPQTAGELEELVKAILGECGMKAQRKVAMKMTRGSVEVDVLAEETVDGIVHRIICECKNWHTNVPRSVVHSFTSVMEGTGANRGYIISREGFQSGAIEAATLTNIELATFAEFQNIYFQKWIDNRIRVIEDEICDFNVYYEPLGRPGYYLLRSDDERAAYDAVWNRYLFAGLMLMPFSPYLQMTGPKPFPSLPFDVTDFERQGVVVPDDIKQASGYREFLDLLTGYARKGLWELRAVNPVTRGKAEGEFVRELDAPMPPTHE